MPVMLCLSVCVQNISKSDERILTKFCGGIGCGPRTNWLHFSGDPDHDPYPGFLDSDHQPDPGTQCAIFSVQFSVCTLYSSVLSASPVVQAL